MIGATYAAAANISSGLIGMNTSLTIALNDGAGEAPPPIMPPTGLLTGVKMLVLMEDAGFRMDGAACEATAPGLLLPYT